jgi:TnpA family transposase
MSRYFADEGISTYTHVSDQLSTDGTKVIVVTQPEAAYVVDEILGNQTDLPIAEHATDTASLVVTKLSASGPQNTLAAALKEYGLLRRTIYAARYLSDEAYRRRISRQLNKGESLHALRRDLGYAHEGKVRHRHHEDQTEQALCLTVVTNAIVAWTTEYLALAVAERRAGSDHVDDEVLARVSPAHNENVGFYGTFSFEVERELAQLVAGYRPLRLVK